MVAIQINESRDIVEEAQFQNPGGSISIFRYNNFRDAHFVFGSFVAQIVFFTVNGLANR